MGYGLTFPEEQMLIGRISLIVAFALALSSNNAQAAPTTKPKPKKLRVASTDIVKNGEINRLFACPENGGQNVSPQISWSKGPKGTKFYAVFVYDKSAGNFDHWGIYNIPAEATSLEQGASATTSYPQAMTTLQSRPGWFGPCPPQAERHKYEFFVYAYRKAAAVSPSLFPSQIESKISKKSLTSGKFVAFFTEP